MAALAVLAGTFNYFRPIEPVPAVRSVAGLQRIDGSPPILPWPAGGSAAVGAAEIGLVADSGQTTPLPIASVAKAMTALVVVEAQPLESGATGPSTAVTQADVDLYNAEKAEQSTVPVVTGEQLNERQLLEGLLIPSANNFADILARSLAPTPEAFVAMLNARAAALGMTHTHFADASGFNAQTASTPPDLIKLAAEFLAHPVLVEIASMADTRLPVAGTVYNVDYALGKSGIFGIKTGSSGAAGACFLFAARQPVGGGTAVVIGAVLGLPTLELAFRASQRLIEAAAPAFRRAPIDLAGQKVAAYRAPWGSQAAIVPSRDLVLLTWPGLLLHRRLVVPAASPPLAAGADAGTLTAWVGEGSRQTVPLVTADGFYPPGKGWRITRIAGTA